MKLKPYPEYKDSGVEWIGEIPQNWEMRRLKYNCSVNPPGKKSLSDPKAKVNFLPMEKVSEEGDYDLESKTEYENVSSGYTYFEDSDVLLAKITPCFENGKGALVENLKYGFGFGTTEFHILRYGTEIHPKYLYFLTKSHLFRVIGEAFMEGAAGQKRVSTDFVKNFPMPTPSMAEQKLIVNYLEKKTSEIDLTIEKDTRLIELLKEKRTALINHVVTKGLDPTVKMKDSGVEWIGEIPEDWELRKISQSFDIIGSGTTPKSQEERYYDAGDVPWVITGDLNDDILNDTSKKITKEAFRDYSTLKMYQKNSLIIAMYGATIGKISLLNFEACVNQACCVLANSKILKSRFVFYWFLGNKNSIISLSYGGGQPNISQDVIKTLKIQVPPKEKQSEIVRHLEQETSKIDLTIQKIQEHIKLLEEYKKSLIHHVVTGKMDVREVAV